RHRRSRACPARSPGRTRRRALGVRASHRPGRDCRERRRPPPRHLVALPSAPGTGRRELRPQGEKCSPQTPSIIVFDKNSRHWVNAQNSFPSGSAVLESRDRHEKNLARRTGAWPTTEGTREDALIGRRAEALGPPAGGRGCLRAAAGPPSAGCEGRDRGPRRFTACSGTVDGIDRRKGAVGMASPITAPAAARIAAARPVPRGSAGRRPELDVMRALVVAGLVVFHSAMVFPVGTSWFVSDPRPSIGFSVFLLWGSLWGMPLLFLVSGMGVRYAMR